MKTGMKSAGRRAYRCFMRRYSSGRPNFIIGAVRVAAAISRAVTMTDTCFPVSGQDTMSHMRTRSQESKSHTPAAPRRCWTGSQADPMPSGHPEPVSHLPGCTSEPLGKHAKYQCPVHAPDQLNWNVWDPGVSILPLSGRLHRAAVRENYSSHRTTPGLGPSLMY